LTGFVLDASIVMAWHFADEKSPALDRLSLRAGDEGVAVPSHWAMEVANSLLVGERRGRTSIASVAHFIDRLRALPLEIDEVDDEIVFTRILPAARAHRLTVYDALYLDLAERRGLPLATLDADLAAAGKSVGLIILGTEE